MLNEFYHLYGLNEKLFFFVNSLTNASILPQILQFISGIFLIWNFAFAYIAFCIYQYFVISRSNNQRDAYFKIYYELARVAIIYIIFGLTYAALKFNVNMPRPFCSLESYQFITIENISQERCLSSFPSAHTSLAIIVCYVLWPHVNFFIRTISFTLIILVSISRMTLAMHYPMDIFYSFLITPILIKIANMFYAKIKAKFIEPFGKIIFSTFFDNNFV